MSPTVQSTTGSTLAATIALGALSSLASCQWDAPKPPTKPDRYATLSLEFRADGAPRTRQVRFDVRTCSGRRVHRSTALLSRAPMDEQTLDLQGRRFVTVSPDCYRVRAVPLDGKGRRSEDCESVEKRDVEVGAGEEVSLLLASRCEDSERGLAADSGLGDAASDAADAEIPVSADRDAGQPADPADPPPPDIGSGSSDGGESPAAPTDAGADAGDLESLADNTSPRIKSVSFDPSKFVPCDSEVTICAVADDRDGEPTQFDWQKTGGPALASPIRVVSDRYLGSRHEQCIRFEPTTGSWSFDLVVRDTRLWRGSRITWEQYYRQLGISLTSRDELVFPLYAKRCDSRGDAGG